MTLSTMSSRLITWEQFIISCQQLISLCKETKENWIIHGDVKNPGEMYISLSLIQNFPKSFFHQECLTNISTVLLEEDCNVIDDQDIQCVIQNCDDNIVINCQYDVTYSLSYSVPVLYFNMSHSNGKQLTLDEVWNIFLLKTGSTYKDLWSTLTQQEHPILQVPFYTLHPCNTGNFMSTICKDNNTNNNCLIYFLSWLSIIGNAVSMPLSDNYAKIFTKVIDCDHADEEEDAIDMQ